MKGIFVTAMERYISFLKLNERELAKSLNEARNKLIYEDVEYNVDDNGGGGNQHKRTGEKEVDDHNEYLKSCEVLHGAIVEELSEAQNIIRTVHESQETEAY